MGGAGAGDERGVGDGGFLARATTPRFCRDRSRGPSSNSSPPTAAPCSSASDARPATRTPAIPDRRRRYAGRPAAAAATAARHSRPRSRHQRGRPAASRSAVDGSSGAAYASAALMSPVASSSRCTAPVASAPVPPGPARSRSTNRRSHARAGAGCTATSPPPAPARRRSHVPRQAAGTGTAGAPHAEQPNLAQTVQQRNRVATVRPPTASNSSANSTDQRLRKTENRRSAARRPARTGVAERHRVPQDRPPSRRRRPAAPPPPPPPPPPPAGGQVEHPVAVPVEQFGEIQSWTPSGHQLDGQGQPAETADERGERRQLGGGGRRADGPVVNRAANAAAAGHGPRRRLGARPAVAHPAARAKPTHRLTRADAVR